MDGLGSNGATGTASDPREYGVPERLLETLRSSFSPSDIWLFGSRARGDARQDSDWDLLVVVDDGRQVLTDPQRSWEASSTLRDEGIASTILVTTESDLDGIWGLPNTIGYDIEREGVRLRVG